MKTKTLPPSCFITNHLDTWSSAIKAKSSAGRGSGKKQEFYGIKKLRELILELAVRGLLVPQDPTDEPASVLIRRVSDSMPDRKSENPFLSEIEASITHESEYELPSGWAWMPLGHVGIWATGCGFPTEYQGESDKEFLFCKVSDMNLPGNEVKIHTTVHTINSEVLKKIRARANPVGTIIFPKIGGAIATHKRRIVIKPTIIDNNCSGIQPIGLTDNQWLLLFMRNLDLTQYQSGTSVPAVSQNSLNPIRIGLPPLAEQHRIVAKVDELMALCDQLEQQQEDSLRTHGTLVQTLLGALTAASERSQFAQAWQRIASHFDTLFTTESSIDQLKQTILQLAVMGKLVEQSPEDEPASVLIRRVSGSLPDKKSENPFLSEIEASITGESEYELPSGWAWMPLGHVGIWATGCGFPTEHQGEADKEFLFCKVSDMNIPGNEVEIHTTVHTIDSEVLKKIRARSNPVGTVIFPKIGGAIATHKRRIVIQPTIIDNNCSGIQPIGLTDNQWLLLFMRNLDLTRYQSGTSVPAVSQNSLNPIRIGLPPLAEQHRIVAKVDELMTLCDRIKAKLQSAQTTQLHLADCLVEAAIH